MTRLLALPVLALAALASAAPPPIQSHRLKNGLEVLVVEDHSLPLVTVEIAVKNGSMTEPPDYNGLSHLYEHMFFKANAVIPSQEAFMARVRELGMQFNGTTGTERVNYFFTTTSDHTAAAMVFMRDAVMTPLFGEAELKRERVVVTGEIDRNEANPYYHFWHETEKRVWWKHPSRKDPLGNRATVLATTRQKMQTIQRRYYVPNNSVLLVVGDVKAADIFGQAEQLYAGWKRAADPFTRFPLVKHPPIARAEVVLVTQPVQTVTMALTWHGPSTVGRSVDLTYAADLLGTALDEPSSKFQKALVDSGACVRAGLSWFTQMNTGPITLGLEATPDKVDACVRAARAEVPRMKSPDYLSDEEMRNAVFRLEVQQALERERPSQLAHTITFWWASAGLDYYRTYVEKLRKVTRADMARYLDAYVLGKPYVFGVMVSPEMEQGANLSRAHFEALLGIPVTNPPAPKGGKR
ncbi:MAG: insulinase family protein [Deltaproteobacteria bacterium]|nr:insulinase family protein [Deltaproteobacteria bacterium]